MHVYILCTFATEIIHNIIKYYHVLQNYGKINIICIYLLLVITINLVKLVIMCGPYMWLFF